MSMPIDEILNYEPEEKRLKSLSDQVVNGETKENAPIDPEELLKAIENDDSEPLDDAAVRRLIGNFEKKSAINTELRVKHAQDPQKFMTSEIELNTAIQELHALAAMPESYALLDELGTMKTILSLLSHENTDIAVAVSDLMQELTSLDGDDDDEAEAVENLIKLICKEQIIDLFVHNLQRFNEANPDESTGVTNILTCVENVVETQPDEIAKQCIGSGLLQWLLRRVRLKAPYDQVKTYSAEILGMLLQSSDAVRQAVGDLNGIDLLLQSVSAFKRRNPETADEKELMENLFDCVCACLMCVPNRQKFLDGEGLQLMILMLRERKQSREAALKVLDFATTGADGVANCNKLVEILGLRTIFPLFLKTPSKAKRAGGTAEEHEEHVCSIIHSLLRNCDVENRERVLSKFKEMDHAKCDRLIELHLKYIKRVRVWEKANPKQADMNEETMQARLAEKMEIGAFTLQLIDCILADVLVNAGESCVHAVKKFLHLKTNVRSIRELISPILTEYSQNLGQEATQEKSRIDTLLDKIDLMR